jgi:nucleotide-binding universal stress UspA family protein
MNTRVKDPQASVLVALDGSPAARTALPVARVIAAQLGATLRILYVAPSRVPESVMRERLHLTPEDLRDAELHLHLGEPAPGILEMVNDPQVLLTVLTTHGRLIEPGRQLGRVAQEVIRRTSRSVLLVRPEAAAQREQLPPLLRCMLFPLDGTPTTSRALQPAAELAGKLGSSIDLLYVINPSEVKVEPEEPGSIGMPYYVDQPQHEWPQWAREVVERMRCTTCYPHDVSVRAFLAYGEIGDEIVRFATDRGEDVIVLVRRSHLEPGRARVLRSVLSQTPCPVLLSGARVGPHPDYACPESRMEPAEAQRV